MKAHSFLVAALALCACSPAAFTTPAGITWSDVETFADGTKSPVGPWVTLEQATWAEGEVLRRMDAAWRIGARGCLRGLDVTIQSAERFPCSQVGPYGTDTCASVVMPTHIYLRASLCLQRSIFRSAIARVLAECLDARVDHLQQELDAPGPDARWESCDGDATLP
jgi:hypothetical protein